MWHVIEQYEAWAVGGSVLLTFVLMAAFGERVMHCMEQRRHEMRRRAEAASRLAEIKRREDEDDYRRALSQDDWDYKYMRRRHEDG